MFKEPQTERGKLLMFHFNRMMSIDKELFDSILDTTGFAYHFNEVCKMALMPDNEFLEGMLEGIRKDVT